MQMKNIFLPLFIFFQLGLNAQAIYDSSYKKKLIIKFNPLLMFFMREYGLSFERYISEDKSVDLGVGIHINNYHIPSAGIIDDWFDRLDYGFTKRGGVKNYSFDNRHFYFEPMF